MLPSAIVDSNVLAFSYAALVYAVMLAISAVLVRRGAPRALTSNAQGRVGSLDGLRGILALGVFVHHSVLSYVWATTGKWGGEGMNAVVIEVGRAGVALFFMITGFLFTRKTLRPMSWGAFFAGRLARVGPLYFLLVLIVVAIVFASTGFELRQPRGQVAKAIASWLGFVVFGRPDINGYTDTYVIIAGVNWSLKYEVLFYVFWVPALFVINRFVKPPVALLATAGSLIGIILFQHLTHHKHFDDMIFYEHFVGGIAVAYAYETRWSRRLIETTWFHGLGAAAALALLLVQDPNTAKAVLLAVVVFAAAAGNASVFGLLKTRPAIWLGDISYGVYLLHGITLWLAYKAVGAPASLGGFIAFALVVGAATVLMATLSYLALEMPFMRLAKGRRAAAGASVIPV